MPTVTPLAVDAEVVAGVGGAELGVALRGDRARRRSLAVTRGRGPSVHASTPADAAERVQAAGA